MKKLRKRSRLDLEQLESRLVPTSSAKVVGGNLVVTANNTAGVTVKAISKNHFTVYDGATVRSANINTPGSVTINGSGAADLITLDMNGVPTQNPVTFNLGNGANRATISGSVAGIGAAGVIGAITVIDGSGADSVTFTPGAGAGNSLRVNGNVTVNTGLGSDSVTISAGATLQGTANQITGATTFSHSGVITGNLTVDSSAKANAGSFNLAGIVSGNALIKGGLGADSITFGSTVSGNATVTSGNGNDTVSVTGQISGTFNVDIGLGDDSVSVGAGAKILGGSSGQITISVGDGDNTVTTAATSVLGNGRAGSTLSILAKSGDDVVTLNDVIQDQNINIQLGEGTNEFNMNADLTTRQDHNLIYGQAGTGNGDDSVTINGGATGVIKGNVNVNLGGAIGSNVFTLAAAADVTGNLLVNGGTGVDSVTMDGTVDSNATVNLGGAGAGTNVLNFTGHVGDNFTITAGPGGANDLATIPFSGTVDGVVTVDFGATDGINTLDFTGSAESLDYTGGTGNDSVTMGATNTLAGFLNIDLGAGDDTLIFVNTIAYLTPGDATFGAVAVTLEYGSGTDSAGYSDASSPTPGTNEFGASFAFFVDFAEVDV